ncbi:pyridoxamine 5'-phosphate oxidase family protein [Flavobacteriaceae bacterium TP-CH-4]|uniref:Pyridoxamine 5'-phosphate oxidase family protein n=1 Tax=Pelagihabitans pacificus TaxID=2696054 RepID=A0A967E825_9FLAO|nr:pyridoxamine 5'-phosphate oxidase family protein [Pelagihabitans pacificus]NHF60859.1 pyridoxamine 5'-phosphate oxidase family protein [Pelagihabitans pacificus]
MELTTEIKKCMERSVLCWLATVSSGNVPNVSPKEIFTYHDNDHIIIANIASPQTVRNIKQHPQVCVSFIDILVQKGFQIKGKGEIIGTRHPEFVDMEKVLAKMTEGKFPFRSITRISVEQVKPIIAPKYVLYPHTTEQEQIESAKKAYGF